MSAASNQSVASPIIINSLNQALQYGEIPKIHPPGYFAVTEL
jgi:hypothetical protein